MQCFCWFVKIVDCFEWMGIESSHRNSIKLRVFFNLVLVVQLIDVCCCYGVGMSGLCMSYGVCVF